METRICKICKKPKALKCFAIAGKNPKYRKWTCHTCRYTAQAKKQDPETLKKKRQEYQRVWVSRHPENVILRETRKSDLKKGLGNDLEAEFIKEFIEKPCEYCGETKIKMSLDRIDNDIGHLKCNVAPACLRCNYTRGSMPHKAWLAVAPAMRKAREMGLFGNWEGRARKEHWKK